MDSNDPHGIVHREDFGDEYVPIFTPRGKAMLQRIGAAIFGVGVGVLVGLWWLGQP